MAKKGVYYEHNRRRNHAQHHHRGHPQILTAPGGGGVCAFLAMHAEVIVLFLIWISGVAVAAVQIRHSRKLAKQKATLAFMRDYNSEKRVDLAFAILRDGKQWQEMNRAQQADIKYLFNFFENLAIGLRSGIYDDDMTQAFFGDEISNIYNIGGAKQIIGAIRTEDHARSGARKIHDEAYYEFQQLAEKIK